MERGRATRRMRGCAAAAVLLAIPAQACAPVGGSPAPASTRIPVGADARRSSAPPAAADDSCAATRGEIVLGMVNRQRDVAGLPPLRADSLLVAAAVAHARDLAGHAGLKGHIGSDGSEPAERVTRAGYPWVRVGENVAAGTPTAGTVVSMWTKSPGHRHNMLTPEFEHAGVGYVDAPASEWGTYWVMVYGTADGGAARPTLRCHP